MKKIRNDHLLKGKGVRKLVGERGDGPHMVIASREGLLFKASLWTRPAASEGEVTQSKTQWCSTVPKGGALSARAVATAEGGVATPRNLCHCVINLRLSLTALKKNL